MKYILVLFALIISCEKFEIVGTDKNLSLEGDGSNQQASGSSQQNLASSANNFSSTVVLDNLNYAAMENLKNLYLNEFPILSSLEARDIQLNFDISSSNFESELNNKLYKGNLSFKINSADGQINIDTASTGIQREELQYNYVYPYQTSQEETRYAWKAFFESQHGAFIVVLKNGVVTNDNKILFSISEGVLYYKEKIHSRSSPNGVGKCWLRSSGFASFDCRTWRTVVGVDIQRELEPDDIYENQYRSMVSKTIARNFHEEYYSALFNDPKPSTFRVETWTRRNNQAVIAALIKNRNKSYADIYESLLGLQIGLDFRLLVAAIPVKLQERSLTALEENGIINVYRRLQKKASDIFRRWSEDNGLPNNAFREDDSQLTVEQRGIIRRARSIGSEYISGNQQSWGGGDDQRGSGSRVKYQNFKSQRGDSGGVTTRDRESGLLLRSVKAVKLPDFVKLADFSSSNVQVAFDLQSLEGTVASKQFSSKRGLSSVASINNSLFRNSFWIYTLLAITFLSTLSFLFWRKTKANKI